MDETHSHPFSQRFPNLFDHADSDVDSLPILARGIECGAGWYPLIDALCEGLQNSADHLEGPQIRVTQIKEKLGGLRFYVRGASERQRGMIDFAQALAFRVCEVCGAPATLVRESWLRTRCNEHAVSVSVA